MQTCHFHLSCTFLEASPRDIDPTELFGKSSKVNGVDATSTAPFNDALQRMLEAHDTSKVLVESEVFVPQRQPARIIREYPDSPPVRVRLE